MLGLLAALCCPPAFAETVTRYRQVTPREHTFMETATYLGVLYVASGLAYYGMNSTEINQNSSLENYFENIIALTDFDHDRVTANWGVHVYTGNLTYQIYRARSYSKTDAFLLTALQSALFEFTLETLQEPVSVEDLVNTPIFGAILGQTLEHASLPLLNSGSGFIRVLGHLLNPPTIFGDFYEGKVKLVPALGKVNGVFLRQEL